MNQLKLVQACTENDSITNCELLRGCISVMSLLVIICITVHKPHKSLSFLWFHFGHDTLAGQGQTGQGLAVRAK